MGWPAWLLIVLLALAALAALGLHLIRFRYAFAYAFPAATEGGMVLSFLLWRKEMPFGEEGEKVEEGGEEGNLDDTQPPAAGQAPPGPGPAPGQAGFLALPGSEPLGARWERFLARLKAASLKWALDPAVWGHLLGYGLRSGLRLLRLAGPSLERLHVGSADVLNLGRFAAAWSSLSAAAPFLACPVEYGFNERPFALRLRISGGCSALQALLFLLALAFTLPWLRLFARFRQCWRQPALEPWQSRLVAAAAR